MANGQNNHLGNRQRNIHVPDNPPMVGAKVGRAMGTSGPLVALARVIQQGCRTIAPERGATSSEHLDHPALRKSWPSTELNHCPTPWAKGGDQCNKMMDKICSMDNLRAAFRRVEKNKGGPGIDGVTIQEFGLFLTDNLTTLAEELKSGQYRPQACLLYTSDAADE